MADVLSQGYRKHVLPASQNAVFKQKNPSIEWEASNWEAQIAAELPKPECQSDMSPEVLLTSVPHTRGRQCI